jgi:hypothetical protein
MDRSVSLTLTAEDYVTANKLHFINGCRSRCGLVTFGVVAIGYLAIVAFAYVDQWSTPALVALGASLVLFVAYMVVTYLVFIPLAARRNYRVQKTIHGLHTYSWSETGLTIVAERGEWRAAWGDYMKRAENARVLMFYQAPKLHNMIPKRVLTAEQIADIRRCAAAVPA